LIAFNDSLKPGSNIYEQLSNENENGLALTKPETEFVSTTTNGGIPYNDGNINSSTLALDKITFFNQKQKQYGSPLVCRGKAVDMENGLLNSNTTMNYSNMIYEELGNTKSQRYFSGLKRILLKNFPTNDL
jgi:hypothetical protein